MCWPDDSTPHTCLYCACVQFFPGSCLGHLCSELDIFHIRRRNFGSFKFMQTIEHLLHWLWSSEKQATTFVMAFLPFRQNACSSVVSVSVHGRFFSVEQLIISWYIPPCPLLNLSWLWVWDLFLMLFENTAFYVQYNYNASVQSLSCFHILSPHSLLCTTITRYRFDC
jgi:hypothetical protein